MNKLSLDLVHCYGIRHLAHTIDFTTAHAAAVYAPNGVMKSSLAQTFKDLTLGQSSQDRVFPGRHTKRDILDERGQPLASDAVLVLPPYDEFFGDSEKTATLLVDSKLRKEYQAITLEIERSKAAFLSALNEQGKSKKDFAVEISTAFTDSNDRFYQALLSVRREVKDLPSPQFANVPYDMVSDERVTQFLATGDMKELLQSYIDTYNKLLAKSQFFRKGTFDYYNAATVAKALGAQGFFRAKHTLNLQSGKPVVVSSQKELEDVIAADKATIMKDDALRRKFNEMEKRITKNEMLRDFQDFLADHEEVLTLMSDPQRLRQEVLKSYCKVHEELFLEVLAKYDSAQKRTREIEAEAARQRTQWEQVIDIFNDRFFVPFKLTARNRFSVIVGTEPVPSLGFTFADGADTKELDKDDLLTVLSTGEKKALYILNVIFEVEVRRQTAHETLFVVDDIADSFDYKNKYAIVQYLKEIADDPSFKLLLLTHNFDFFRTVNSRQIVPYSHCFMAERTGTGIRWIQATGIKNVFVNDWKPHFFDTARKRVAAISFLRNIVEFTRGDGDPDYATLTALLHFKPTSETIQHSQLDDIYNRVFGGTGSWPDPAAFVLETIQGEARGCLTAPQGANLENKIALSIAIRLAAEQHMISAISDATFVASIAENQTARLVQRYRLLNGVDDKAKATMDRVALMTPENIHLNSFMYEPILDMSDDHLRKLFRDVLSLVFSPAPLKVPARKTKQR